MSELCLQTAARNPREITISLAFVCRKPSCIKNRILHSGSSSSCTVHQFVFREGLKACHLQLFIQPMKYLWRKFLLFDTSFQSFSIHLGLESGLSCQSLKNEREKQSKIVGVLGFTVYHAMHIHCFSPSVWRHCCSPLWQPIWQWEVWLQCDTEKQLAAA